jgi:release factor glutamine methyltransferase
VKGSLEGSVTDAATGAVTGAVTSLREAVRDAVRTLEDAGVESGEYDAVALAAYVLRTSTSEVRKLMIMGAPVPEGFGDLVAERARRVPLQHLTGKAGFRRLELSVGPGVFVPRFETEFVAGQAISLLGKPRDGAWESRTNLGIVHSTVPRFAGGDPTPSLGLAGDGVTPSLGLADDLVTPSLGLAVVVVDLCTGSGAIALAIKDEVPAAEVHGVELSELAYAWAIRNRDDLGLDVDLRLGDATVAFPDLEGEVDLVVSNPPYIPMGSIPNDQEVRDHDPEVALYGGSSDGLRTPLEVAARAAVLLRPGGLLVMEHADVQGDSLPAALRKTGAWQDLEDFQDLNGRPRVVIAVRAH